MNPSLQTFLPRKYEQSGKGTKQKKTTDSNDDSEKINIFQMIKAKRAKFT